MKTVIRFPQPLKAQTGLCNEYSCGCQVRSDGTGCYTIHACPLHNAAGELLEACKVLREAVLVMADPEHCLHQRPETVPWRQLADQARAALAKATAGEPSSPTSPYPSGLNRAGWGGLM